MNNFKKINSIVYRLLFSCSNLGERKNKAFYSVVNMIKYVDLLETDAKSNTKESISLYSFR